MNGSSFLTFSNVFCNFVEQFKIIYNLMKKFLLLLTTSLSVMTASAGIDLRGVSVVEGAGLSRNFERSTPRRINRASGVQREISYDQPSGEWTEWTAFGSGTLALNDMFGFLPEFDDMPTEYNGVAVDRREDVANPGIVQFRFNDIFDDADLILNYYPENGNLLKMPLQNTNITSEGFDLLVGDFASCYEAIDPADMGMSQEEMDEVVEMYNGYNYYLPDLGRFYVFLGFMLEGLDDAVGMADAQMQLNGFTDMTPIFDDATFYSPENAVINMTVNPAVGSVKYGFFEGLGKQANVESVLEGGEGITTVAGSCEIAIPESAPNTLRNIGAASFSTDGEPLEWNSKLFTVIADNDSEWRSLGNATVTSDIFEDLFNEEPSVYECEMQEKIGEPGIYRLVNAFTSAYPLNTPGDYDTEFNHYLIIDATNPSSIVLAEQFTGNNFGGGYFVLMSKAAYYLSIGQPYGADDVATLEDGVISFPANSLMVWCADWEALGGQNNALYSVNEDGLTNINLPIETGVSDIVNSEAPETFYNLQGIRIATPKAGEIVIVRQGDKVTKYRW